jgi:hypothetical protein
MVDLKPLLWGLDLLLQGAGQSNSSHWTRGGVALGPCLVGLTARGGGSVAPTILNLSQPSNAQTSPCLHRIT